MQITGELRTSAEQSRATTAENNCLECQTLFLAAKQQGRGDIVIASSSSGQEEGAQRLREAKTGSRRAISLLGFRRLWVSCRVELVGYCNQNST